MGNHPDAGKIVEEKRNRTLETTFLKFSNGVSVTLKHTDNKNNDILMDAWRWGGSHNYSLQNKENATHAARIVQLMGVKDLSKTDLDKMLAGKNVHVLPYINPYEEGIEGNCSATNFKEFIQLVNLYFTQPRKDETIFKAYIEKEKGYTKNLKANPLNYFNDTLIKIEYQSNPWAWGIPTAEEYDRINLDSAFKIYKEIFSNAYGMHFTFVGSFDIESMKQDLVLILGSLPSTPMENKFNDEGLRPVKGIVERTIQKGQEKQSMVNITFTGEAPYNHEEELKLKMLTEVMHMEVMDKLRGSMNGIYKADIASSFSKRPYQHYTINIKFPCGAENIDTLTQAVFDIVKNVQEQKINRQYVNKVKEMMKDYHAGSLKRDEYLLHFLSHSWIDQEDPDWLNDYYNLVENISLRELKETAIKYFDMNNYIKVVLKPE